MNDYLKYWPLAIFVGGIISTWAVFGTRLTAVESMQDRQGEAITLIQGTLRVQEANYAALSAKIDAMSDNINYIRSRIDAATK